MCILLNVCLKELEEALSSSVQALLSGGEGSQDSKDVS